MKIKSISDIKSAIGRTGLFAFLIIFTFSIIVIYLTHRESVQKSLLLRQQEINNSIKVYISNLSEKLSIIASSSEFIDFIRSGEITRDK